MDEEKRRSAEASPERYAIAVSAAVQFVPEQSDEAVGRYVFAYTITIRNTGSVAAQLISRRSEERRVGKEC